MELTNSILFVGAIGAIMGILIALASSIFHVEEDTRVEEVAALLPQFNCGACGTPGCHAMAEALVAGTITIDKCRPAKPEQKEAVISKLNDLDILVK